MQEWTESELNWYLGKLASDDAEAIAGALYVVAEIHMRSQAMPVPTGNAKVIARLEQLLEDRRVCKVGPYGSYISGVVLGELRWLAARALACEYAYLGIDKTITLKDVLQPMWNYEIVSIDPKKTIKELVQQGLVPRKTEIIKPQDYAHCCTKEAVEKRRQNQDEENDKE